MEEPNDNKEADDHKKENADGNKDKPSPSEKNSASGSSTQLSPTKRDLVRKRVYRDRMRDTSSEADSDDESGGESKRSREANDSLNTGLENTTSNQSTSSDSTSESDNAASLFARGLMDRVRTSNFDRLFVGDSDDSDDSDEEEIEMSNDLDIDTEPENTAEQVEPIKIADSYSIIHELHSRQLGCSTRIQGNLLYRQRFYDSLFVPSRLEMVDMLDYHRGCVNSLNFNSSGNLLASGSDDLKIALWDWAKRKTILTYKSGHRNNVFHTKFLLVGNDNNIVSCARDGQIRLAELSSTGVCVSTKRLAKHAGPAHKISLRLSNPYEVVTVGEDSYIFSVDIRAPNHEKIGIVKDIKGNKVPLYSVSSHPMNDNQFCVSGKDQYVRVYDRRISSLYAPPALKYCPKKLEDKPNVNVTSVVYSNNGDAILASYNDEDIYLFDTSLTSDANYLHKYSGHLNTDTVKGVNFFGPNSNYIVSGSDCGHIFLWHRETERIVQCLHADVNGVVNVLEPHPTTPVLATSGLDDQVKIWMPLARKDPDYANIEKRVKINTRKKRQSVISGNFGELDSLLNSQLFDIWRVRRRTIRRRPEDEELPELLLPDVNDSSSSTSSGGDSDDDSDIEFRSANRTCAFQ